jgi:hypothetical protein
MMFAATPKSQTINYCFLSGQFTSWIVRRRMAILCEPEFFFWWALGLSSSAKNSGWKIALNFAQLFSRKS